MNNKKLYSEAEQAVKGSAKDFSVMLRKLSKAMDEETRKAAEHKAKAHIHAEKATELQNLIMAMVMQRKKIIDAQNQKTEEKRSPIVTQ